MNNEVNKNTDVVDEFLNIESYNENMDKFLEEKQKNQGKDTWTKLDKTTKIKKLNLYVDENYAKTHNLSNELINKCKIFLYEMLEKKKFVKNKDITFDKEKCVITNIPNLNYNSNNKTFFLTSERKVSTLKSLPVLKKKKLKKSKTENDKDVKYVKEPQNNKDKKN